MLQSIRFLAACLMGVGAWIGPFQQTDPGAGEPQVHITQVDTSHFPTITVYISATDANGEPLGVDPNNIVLYENGQTLKPESVGGQGAIGPLTTLLVIDVSGSMNEGGKLAAAKSAAHAYVAQMRPGDRAGLLTFNTQVNDVQPITADRQALLNAIDGLKAKGDTALYEAMAQAVKNLEPVNGRKAIIALTDGLNNRGTVKPDEVIKQIGPSGLSISTIGLGDPAQLGVTNAGLDVNVLTSFAEQAGGRYGYANDPDSLRALYERYGRALQSEYVLTYTSPSTLRDGVNRSLSVSLTDSAQPAAAAAYNPGGLVPEVAQTSWPLFGLILLGLLALLAVPLLFTRGAAVFQGLGAKRQKQPPGRLTKPAASRIRLK